MKIMIEACKYKQLEQRTKDFAHRLVKLALALEGTRLGNHIAGQLMRCATSVAANYRACNLSQSRASFKAKLSIVLEEADECLFWVEFATEEKLINENKVKNVIEEAKQLKAIFYSSRKTLSSGKK